MKKLYLIIIMSLIACFIYAEPTPTVQWLMNEPVTLFDLGMLQLKILSLTEWKSSVLNRIKRLKLPLEFRRITIDYSWDDNVIVINLRLLGKPDEKLCKQVWNEWANTIDIGRSFRQSKSFRELPSEFSFSSGEMKHIWDFSDCGVYSGFERPYYGRR